MVSQTIFKRYSILVLVLFTTVIVGLTAYIPKTIRNYSEQLAITRGTDTLKQFSILRHYYTDNVINKLIAHDEFTISHNHKNNRNTFPLPITMIKDLSKQYEALGIKINLYSPFRFKDRVNTPLDSQQQNIWDQLNHQPNTVFSNARGDTVSVALPDLMISPTCIKCHNSHPLSPKNNWQLGDVRGVFQVDIDISDQINKGFILSYSIAFVLVILLLIVFTFMLMIFRKQEIEVMNFFNATHDPLTKLYNRLFFFERLELALNQVDRNENRVAIAFIDLDGFKTINDTHGHDVGDKTLLEVAQRLQSATREVDTVARLGGDEFAVLLDSVDEDNLASTAERIRDFMSSPFEYNEVTINISCSIGLAVAPDNSCDNSTLMRMADKAMYQAKMAGKNTYRFYTTEQ